MSPREVSGVAPELLADSTRPFLGSERRGGSSMVRLKAVFVNRIVPFTALFALSASAAAGEIRGRILVSDRADNSAWGVTVAAVPGEARGEEARGEIRGADPPKPIASVLTGAD